MKLSIGLHVRNKHSGKEGIVKTLIEERDMVKNGELVTTGAYVVVGRQKAGVPKGEPEETTTDKGVYAWHITDIEVVAGRKNLRIVRQIKRMRQVRDTDPKYLPRAAAINYVTFGGNIEQHKKTAGMF